ncbi:hypothetical protein Hsw_3978 [Hymenobacter swuensis DY53]|uniref:Biopolymer transport protein ExbD/TolR n=2 Tax=Hymenobacter TaxID=89966 RepID=W8F3P3_9BACT|nr:hypothetical protein Hsw_3978 [Hymenobacter swuensis DY53]
MTPMAGVGFLLVAFFMLNSTLSRSTLLELAMPVKPTPTAEIPSHCCGGSALTLLLGADNRIFYYWGMGPAFTEDGLHETNLGSRGLRRVLLGFRAQPCPLVLVKPSDKVSYHQLVDVLDELHITVTTQYVLADLTAADKQLLVAGP